jgi:hypothetical protein
MKLNRSIPGVTSQDEICIALPGFICYLLSNPKRNFRSNQKEYSSWLRKK